MAIWTPEQSGCSENPGVFDVGGRIQSRRVSRGCPGVIRVETSSYPYGQSGPDAITYEGPKGEGLTHAEAQARLVWAETTLEPEEWLAPSSRCEFYRNICVGQLSADECADLLGEVAELRREKLVRCRMPRTYPQAAGGYATHQEGDPKRATVGTRYVAYDADGDPIGLICGDWGGLTVEGLRRRLHERIESIRETAARVAAYHAGVTADRERLRPVYELALSRVRIATRTGKPDRGQVHSVEGAYEGACTGYDHDRHHAETRLRHLAGEALAS